MRLRTESARDVRMIGTRAPSTMPAASAFERKTRFLASMLPASRSGTTRICALPATADLMPLILAASGSIALSNASGPSRMPPVICPRSAILQSAAASMVDGIFEVTVSTAERIATRGVPRPICVIQIDRVLDDVALGVEIGEYVDCGVGDEKRLGIGRHIHDENMADAPRRAQARARRGNRPHELVGMQAALHQQLALRLVDEFDRLCGGRIAMRDVDDLELPDVDLVLARDGGDLVCRADEDRNDDAGLGGLDRTAQRGLVARMHDDRLRWRDALRAGDQSIILRSNGVMPRDRGL